MLRPSIPLAQGRHLRCAWLHCAGVLACLDGFMNIAMEQTEEYVNGQLKAKYGDAFIRGNNGSSRTHARTRTRAFRVLPTDRAPALAVLYISTTKRKA